MNLKSFKENLILYYSFSVPFQKQFGVRIFFLKSLIQFYVYMINILKLIWLNLYGPGSIHVWKYCRQCKIQSNDNITIIIITL